MNLKKVTPVVAALAVIAAGVSYAAIPSSNGTISACRDNKGTLKVIDAELGQTCGANQQPLSWNQQGPTGPQGDAGPQGPAGRDGVGGYEITYAETAYNSETEKSQLAYCPSGKMPVAGGASMGTQNGSSWITPNGVALTATLPSGNAWAAVAHEAVPTDQQWQLIVYAICVTTS